MNQVGKFFLGALEFVRAIAIVLVVAFLLRAYVVHPFIVDGHSMEPNLHPADYILVEKLSYYFRKPAPGDVVIFRAPERPEFNYVKRVIALPDDEVEIRNGGLYLNGKRLSEPYLTRDEMTLIAASPDTKYRKKMGTRQYFVLGDNRDASSDSRDWGPITAGSIIGRAWVTVYPLRDFGGITHAQPMPAK